VPLGYLIAALFPQLGKGGLHVTFIGGFGLLAFSISSQVILGHGGFEQQANGYPRSLAAMVALLVLALAARMMVELRADQVTFWISWASGLFLLATLCWGGLLLPRLLQKSPSG
jgi:uncharacterized protein involved in response to NO